MSIQRARQVRRHDPTPPYLGSVAIINAILREELTGLGVETSCVWRVRNRIPDISDWVPLPAARVIRRMAAETVDLEIRDNTSYPFYPPPRRGGQKNVLFLHALLSPGEQWLGSDAIDRYWANSDYLARVLSSMLAMPDWTRGRLFDARAFAIAGKVTLPLPYLEMPGTAIVDGAAELPPAVRAAMESDDVLGHCVTGKLDEKATYAILLALNQLALAAGSGRRFRLCIDSHIHDTLQRWLEAAPAEMPPVVRPLAAALGQLRLRIGDILVPIPMLAQPALFELVRACRFGLQYHWLPEPFGLFPLESVCLGCPVYTNGAGNLRYLLPAGCGINVFETAAMAGGDLAAWLPVAQRIFHDTVVDPGPARESCRRGAEHIAAVYTRRAMRRDLEARLAELAQPAPEHDLAAARIGLGPMVRSYLPETRRVISDWRSAELSPDQAALIGEVVGQSCGELACRRRPEAMAMLDDLLEQGILALLPAEAGTGTEASAAPHTPS